MEIANGAGLHKRTQGISMDEKSPVTDTDIKIESPKDKIPDSAHPGGDAHGPLLQGARVVALFAYFWGACACMNFTQFLGAPVYFYDREWYYAWMALTKQHFALLLVTMQQWWTPTTVRVSWDKSVRGQLKQAPDGRLECDFPERMVLVANHELYTDWLYLWWIAYTARMHGHIFIILKESLKYVPILGWGMQFFSFIFLSRNWTKDKERFAHRLRKLRRPQQASGEGRGKGQTWNPMWMLIFPEGTNLSPNARRKSRAWAEKQGIKDCEHVLLPRSTGLKFCLDELAGTVEWVYDCTLAYEGIPRGQYGQDIYTLRAMYLQGRAPASVNMHWRRFLVADIPKDSEEFEAWVLERWREKDQMVEVFMQTGRFPADEDGAAVVYEDKEMPNGAGVKKIPTTGRYIETQVMPSSPVEFLQIFVPMLGIALIIHLIRRFWTWLLVALAINSKS